MYIYEYENNSFERKFIVVRNPNKKTNYIIYRFLKVSLLERNKYAGKLFSSFLHDFLDEYEDLEHLYEKFHLNEYDSYRDYLYKYWLMDYEEIDYLLTKCINGQKLCFVDMRDAPSNNINNLLDHEEVDFLLRINNVLEGI